MWEPVLQPPADGFDKMEKLFLKDLFVSAYKSIKDPTTRFIILAYFECGYTQDQISEMTGFSQPAILKRIRETQEMLRRKHIIKSG
jgi:DNA-directed RNA polymerase specialized sigma24 family protein